MAYDFGKIRFWVGVFSLGLWGISLTLPVFGSDGPNEASYGYMILVVGPVGIIGGQFGWYANLPFAILIYKLFIRQKAAPIFGVASMLLALLSFTSLSFYLPDGPRHKEWFVEGFYFWFVAICLASLFTIADNYFAKD